MLDLKQKIWPDQSEHGRLRLASERAVSVFFTLAGVSGLAITAINIPYLEDYPLSVTLGGLIALMCLAGPFMIVGTQHFARNTRMVSHLVASLLLALSLTAQEMVSPSNLLFIPAVLTVTLALGWRDGLATLLMAYAAYVGTFMMTGAEWASVLPDVSIFTLIAGQVLAATFVFAGARVFRTQMVQAAIELQRKSEQAEEATRVKSEFLATVSHEIRTPLNGVLGMARVLDDGSLRPDQSDQVQAITRSGEVLLSTLNDVLDLSRIEEGLMVVETRPFDLPAMINGVAQLYVITAAEKSVEFFIEISPDLDLTQKRVGDENRITQILHNLLSNAIKFTAEGRVDLVVSPGETPADIRFTVRDTGIGMSEAEVRRVFERFTQADQSTSRKYGGSGLGLCIASQLATLMGGRIDVQSEPGVGSCFTASLKLPAHDGARVQDGPEAMAVSPPANTAARDLKILVVDDVSINREVMRGLLAKLGFSAEFAASGEEAMDAVRQAEFGTIFLDISMPGLSGYEVLEQIRALERAQARPPSKIVAQTANMMTHQVREYGEAGFDGVLGKPVRLELLQEQLDAA